MYRHLDGAGVGVDGAGNRIDPEFSPVERFIFRGGDSRRGENETEKQDLAHVKRLH